MKAGFFKCENHGTMPLMLRSVSSLLVVCVFVWILPLGAFIKPSQEKTACGGNRAFHMCTMAMSQTQKNPGPQKISFTSASGVEKTNKSASSSGDNGFTNGSNSAKIQDSASKLVELDLILPRQLFFPVPAPIPKA